MTEKFVKKDMTAPRDRILMAAWDLFHEKGIEGTSIDDILQHSETGKSQFYHYFGSKDGIVHAALETARDMIANNMIEGCGEINSWEELEGSLSSYADKLEHYNFERSCPLGRFATELGVDDDLTRKNLQLIFEAKKRYLRDFLIGCKAKGELRDDTDIDALVEFAHAAIQGASIFGKIYKSTIPVEQVHKQILEYLKSFKK